MEKSNKVDQKVVNDEVDKITRSLCDSSFKSTEREARHEAFFSKTNPPAVG